MSSRKTSSFTRVNRTSSPVSKRTSSPVSKRTSSPVSKRSSSPRSKKSSSPRSKRSSSPVYNRSSSPVSNRSSSPLSKRSSSPRSKRSSSPRSKRSFSKSRINQEVLEEFEELIAVSVENASAELPKTKAGWNNFFSRIYNNKYKVIKWLFYLSIMGGLGVVGTTYLQDFLLNNPEYIVMLQNDFPQVLSKYFEQLLTNIPNNVH
jgi:predicted component of type VI protein secretion system